MRVKVVAQPDHLARFFTTPRNGLLELIWNALDADATEVKTGFTDGALGAPDSVFVEDNGTGISPDRAETEFGALGGSWKRSATTTDRGRALHGRLGGGRFAAYALGNDARWNSVSQGTTGRARTLVTGNRAHPDEFDISTEPTGEETPTGTVVTMADLTSAAVKYIESDKVVDDLAAALAIYLSKYGPKVIWREKVIDPASLIQEQAEENLVVPALGDGVMVPMTIIEWKGKVDRALFLCDAEGVALHEMAPGIQAPGHQFTAYIRWDGFAARAHDLALEGAAEEPVPSVIAAAQDALRAHFKRKTDERHTRMIQKWKEEKSYPYSGTAEKPAEVAKRELFDIVAIAAAPAVERIDTASRKFSLRLLAEAIETSPETVHTLLQEVLNLSEQDAADLHDLVQKTSMSNLIAASRLVADRLDFLASLDVLINEPDIKKIVRERSQLHRILASETWVFGEEFALVGDDQTLRTVLRTHLDIFETEVGTADKDIDTDTEVTDPDGRRVVPDLLLSKVVKQRREHREHLVIELKRPSVSVGRKELSQIENYADTVAKDNRFAGTDTRWEFWIVGDRLEDAVADRANAPDREPGVVSVLSNPDRIVKAVTWAQIIRDAKQRLLFVQESIDYDPSTEAGLQYLRQKHAQYLPAIALGADAPEVPEPVDQDADEQSPDGQDPEVPGAEPSASDEQE